MKSWVLSKTIWFNLVMIILGMVAYFQSVSTFDKYAVALGAVATLGNLVLRYFFTNEGLS